MIIIILLLNCVPYEKQRYGTEVYYINLTYITIDFNNLLNWNCLMKEAMAIELEV